MQARRARLMALMPLAKPIMGVTLLLVGVALYFHLFRTAESWLLDRMPPWLLDLSVRFSTGEIEEDQEIGDSSLNFIVAEHKNPYAYRN